MSATEVMVMPREESIARVSAEDFLPLLTLEQAVNRKHQINQFIGQVLKDGDDYGEIPGANKKKVLLKPGAEKLCSIFGLAPTYHKETVIEDWTGEAHAGEPLFYYEYRCQLSRGGKFMGEAIGSCNSWEVKYRYRWVTEDVALPLSDSIGGLDAFLKKGGKRTLFEPQFALDKRETGGQYGKPLEHWALFDAEIDAGRSRMATKKTKAGKPMAGIEIDIDQTLYRIPNPDVAEVINTLQKMAQKRSLVAAVLVVTNCSDAFTQDIEDFQETSQDDRGHRAGIDGNAGHDSAGTEREIPGDGRRGSEVRNLPPEIEVLFKDSVPNGATTAAFNLVKAALSEALPQNGHDEYQRILEHNGIKAKGNTIAQSRNAVMQCWTLAQSAKKARKQTGDLGVNMSDLPDGQGRELPIEEEPAQ